MLKLIIIFFLFKQTRSTLPGGFLETVEQFLSGFSFNFRQDRSNNDRTSCNDYEYDFIVVGAGSGGSVVINRLTENPEWKILALESGKEEIFLTDIPLIAPILHITDFARLFKAEPKLPNPDGSGGYCLSMNDYRCNMCVGNAVGGTSVVNFMIYSRGSPADYDRWVAHGNPGWSYEEILPYFMKSENCKLPFHDPRFHGRGGYLDVTTSPYVSPLRDKFLEAGEELGYDVIDYNTDRTIGFSQAQANLRNGHRVSANKAFIRPIRNRPNFRLSKFTQVTKITFDPRTKAATGVEYLKDNKRCVARARKEVILCAGTVGSAQLLMLSGVGPKDHLKSLGIDVIADLPVGYNYQDHVSISALTFLVNETVTLVESRVVSNLANTFDYIVRGTGPFTVPGAAEGIAFIDTKAEPKNSRRKKVTSVRKQFRNNMSFDPREAKSKIQGRAASNATSIKVELNGHVHSHLKYKKISRQDDPDVELVFGLSALTGDMSGSYKSLIGVTDEFFDEMFSEYKGHDAFSIVPVILRPKSIGRMTLKSSNPFDTPIFNPNYYDDKDDMKTMIRGIRKAIEIASTRAFGRYNATLMPVPFPGCKDIPFNTDPYWECAARHVTTNLGHYVGTCRMGTRENSGVVDHRLRVHGINGLRVVDASIMPTIISGHTNAPVYMIAEKASDMIKEDWDLPVS